MMMYIDPMVLVLFLSVLLVLLIFFLVRSHFLRKDTRREDTPLEHKPETSVESMVRAVLIRRIDGIKDKDQQSIADLVDEERYTKFDDWPPFERQGLSGLDREGKGLRVLEEYDYETSDWQIDVFGDSALASFIVNYRGRIRDLKFNIRSRVTAFLLRRDGRWKLVHEHWSRFPEQILKKKQR